MNAPGRGEVVLVAAVARNGVIGRDGGLPWHLPADLAFFRDATMGHPVLMGRRTWQALPARVRPLPGRRNLVVTRDAGFAAPGAEVVPSFDAALARVADAPRICVIGGAQLYAAALPHADVLLLTEIDLEADGDTHFPAWPRADYEEAWRTRHDSGQGFRYDFVEYRRRH
jgi:dihydrofolate reductase